METTTHDLTDEARRLRAALARIAGYADDAAAHSTETRDRDGFAWIAEQANQALAQED